MESFEFNTPTDDELSRFLESAENQINESDEIRRRQEAILRQLSYTLLRYDYEPLTPNSARFLKSTRDVSIQLLETEMRESHVERDMSAEEIYDTLDDEHRERVHNIATMVLADQHQYERLFLIEIIITTDQWEQGMHNIRLGGPESMALYNDMVARKKDLYAQALVNFEFEPDNPVVKAMLDFLPGEFDPDSDEMMAYMTSYFADNALMREAKKAIIEQAYARLGIDLDDPDVVIDYEKLTAINKIAWQASLYSVSGMYAFENALREEARELPLTNDEVQQLIDFFTEVYSEALLTSPPDEAE